MDAEDLIVEFSKQNLESAALGDLVRFVVRSEIALANTKRAIAFSTEYRKIDPTIEPATVNPGREALSVALTKVVRDCYAEINRREQNYKKYD